MFKNNNISMILLVVFLSLLNCSVTTQKKIMTTPENISNLNKNVSFIKAHMHNGEVFVLSRWTVNDDETIISGIGKHLDLNRLLIKNGEQVIVVDSVAIFESNHVRTSGAVAAMTIVTGASLALTAYCISNPKACFGSCPTFYADINGQSKLVAEGFSSSVAPSLEKTDIDALYQVVPKDGMLKLLLTNEALETHVIRHAKLLAVPKNNGRVFHDSDNNFYTSKNILTPVNAFDDNGDCLSLIATYDNQERISLTDSLDLATKETIELQYTALPSENLGIIIGCRQSLLSTFLLYQTLSYMGRQAAEWIAALEKMDTEFSEKIGGVGKQLGGIEVLLELNSGEFVSAGSINETGPLATDVHLLRIRPSSDYTGNVNLVMAKGHWRIDYIAMVSLDGKVEPLELQPTIVKLISGGDVNAKEKLLDENKLLVTNPGDVYELAYELPDDYENYECFLSSRGYYLEWMRDEWLAEENKEMALLMFLNPQEALKILAPKYKLVEAEMEDYFWNSKYAH